MRALDCQAFAGAFTLGTVRAGFDLVGKLEMTGGFGVPNVEANRHLIPGPWESHVGDPSDWPAFGDVQYVFGNPPCSGFSGLNTSSGENAVGGLAKINDCMWAFADTVIRERPIVATFESVPTAGKETERGGRWLMRQLHQYVKTKTGLPYVLTNLFMSGGSVGASQMRHRYFWVLSQVPFGVDKPALPYIATYRDALGDLVGLKDQWEPQQTVGLPVLRGGQESSWLKEKNIVASDDAHSIVDSHVSAKSPMMKRLETLFPVWEQGKTMKQVIMEEMTDEVPEGWAPHNWKKMRDPEQFTINGYKRIEWERCGYVITGAGGQAWVHPDEDRTLTLRECARLMGFPDNWTWRGAEPKVNTGFMWVGKQIPVQSGEWVSNWVRESIEGRPGSITGEYVDEDELVINTTNAYRDQYKRQLADTL